MSHIPPLQVLWLVVYWAGLGPVVYLFLYGFVGGASLQSFAALALAIVAHLIGAIWATRLARAHLASTPWVTATTTIRVIAVAWRGIGTFIVVGTVISSLLPIELGDTGGALGFVGTVGSVSLLAIIGPGWADHREARDRLRATT